MVGTQRVGGYARSDGRVDGLVVLRRMEGGLV